MTGWIRESPYESEIRAAGIKPFLRYLPAVHSVRRPVLYVHGATFWCRSDQPPNCLEQQKPQVRVIFESNAIVAGVALFGPLTAGPDRDQFFAG
jgi:hypothetical protein